MHGEGENLVHGSIFRSWFFGLAGLFIGMTCNAEKYTITDMMSVLSRSAAAGPLKRLVCNLLGCSVDFATDCCKLRNLVVDKDGWGSVG